MKIKYILLLIIIVLPFTVFTVEGACSWHGGIDCSIGPDWDGSIICMDGYTESGERYFGQKMCEDTPMCTQYMWNQISDTLEMNEDKSKYYKLIKLINTLNLEYPIIEIKIQEENRGSGVTTAGIAPQISGAQRLNRNTVATSTYELSLLGDKLRERQFEINKICIDEGIKFQEKLINSINISNTISVPIKNNLNIEDNPYQNIREKKIYKDVKQTYSLNTEISCNKLGLFGEDLAMCEVFAQDSNKNSWSSIDRPEVKVVTSASFLEERLKKDAIAKDSEIIKQNIGRDDVSKKSLTEINNITKVEKNIQEGKIKGKISTSTITKTNATNPIIQNTTSTSEFKSKNTSKKSIFKKLDFWFKSIFK